MTDDGSSSAFIGGFKRRDRGGEQERQIMDREAILSTVDAARDEIVELTRSLVALQTVNTGEMPTGNETQAAEMLRTKLVAEGIHEVQVLGRTLERGNL